MLASQFPPYARERSEHNADCAGVPSRCTCPGATNFWQTAPGKATEILIAPGKWQVFPPPAETDAAWNIVKEYTRRGDLGFASKISFGRAETAAIMLYTNDESDDVKDLVRNTFIQVMQKAGLPATARSIKSWKSQNSTNQGIYSNVGVPKGGPVSKFHAQRERTVPCKFYNTSRGCNNGQHCPFLHATPSASGGAGGAAAARRYDALSVPPVAAQPTKSVSPRFTVATAECRVCYESVPEPEGVFCREGGQHFYCRPCLRTWVDSEVSDGESFNARDGALKCVVDGCSTGAMDWMRLMPHLPPSVSARVTAALSAALKNSKRIADELAKQVADGEARRREEAARMAAAAAEADESKRMRAMQQVLEEALTLRCPRCSLAVGEVWDGCDALKCGTLGCGAALCGLCMADCGGDKNAYKHK